MNLRARQIDLAIAGGVYLNLLPDSLVSFSRIGAISRRGECRPFDAQADGFVMGEGAGAVILKRLDDALRDGDRIYAVVKGAAANNDGKSEGPMTPRQGGQLDEPRRRDDPQRGEHVLRVGGTPLPGRDLLRPGDVLDRVAGPHADELIDQLRCHCHVHSGRRGQRHQPDEGVGLLAQPASRRDELLEEP